MLELDLVITVHKLPCTVNCKSQAVLRLFC